MKKIALFIFLNFALIGCSQASAQSSSGTNAIQQASNADKHLFIFFYKDHSSRTTQAQTAFDQTMKQIGDKALSAKINITNAEEKDIVDKYDLKKTPMPFVLVLAPNGAVTGGFPSSFTQDQLLSSITSPGAAACLKALQQRKLVILSLQNSRTANNEEALRGAKELKADPQFQTATEIVLIDPTSPEEHAFLNQFGVNLDSTQALTVLIAPPSTVIGTYVGPTSKAQFVSDLKQATAGCCGPGGCCPGGNCK